MCVEMSRGCDQPVDIAQVTQMMSWKQRSAYKETLSPEALLTLTNIKVNMCIRCRDQIEQSILQVTI